MVRVRSKQEHHHCYCTYIFHWHLSFDPSASTPLSLYPQADHRSSETAVSTVPMADPTVDASAVDEFAQTRGGDDLFDDEIIPVSTEEQAQSGIEPQKNTTAEKSPDDGGGQAVPAQTPHAQTPHAQTPSPRPRGTERGRGRGKGRGRGGRGTSGQRRAEGGSRGNKPSEGATETEGGDGAEDSAKPEKAAEEDDAASDSKAPSASNGNEGPRVPAVRGDRSATGGIKKVWGLIVLIIGLVYANYCTSQNSRKSNCPNELQLPRKMQRNCQLRMPALKPTRHHSSSARK